ncbi:MULTISPECIES: helix-turn-helix domain-containing protein [Paenarthrobacter]|uniref:Helix-turn-helix domain-containing protein n=1 Tax=Paenarthrobacter ureafaciens TaxID=37931 RepID=A0AAX3EL55_PAEUR|nr:MULTISPECIES: helix-turn-helix domain-containing protein [Paenarthrobacter]NKR11272.1 XRE family transcriptional regulator [Arthrobacter sp. M5]NKR15134.1 XRE family transcriptional regulator [Arthrobacter sp. M6]OEH57212.1 XRE family transcriptional regulator [Arthrobacter sp. D4]OEH57710.1 XRE family transcriptional regulator [Arthrobacter sp. D2]MDO5863552.1 helix-turn-helix domain-containing protein [Paenarthrobacter sp. SD-2]
MDPDFSKLLGSVGPRLRALRTQRNVTLAEASEATGISVSTLSRLESGQRKPTLELLLPLARLHQVPLEELIDAPETGDPRVHLKPHVHEWGTALPLTRRPGGIQAFKMILPGASGNEVPNPQSHEGYDWMYILNGKLRLILGENDFVLKAGEAAEFDTRTPHWFASATSKPVELLTLFGQQGERIHLRAKPKR